MRGGHQEFLALPTILLNVVGVRDVSEQVICSGRAVSSRHPAGVGW
jgi:hypothetical protein